MAISDRQPRYQCGEREVVNNYRRIKLIVLVLAILSACGLSSSHNELEGQVKKVVRRTPFICPDYVEVDVSLGVLRNGVGSISKEDVQLYVADEHMAETLQRAAKSGSPVTIGYDVQRVALCRPSAKVISVMVEQ